MIPIVAVMAIFACANSSCKKKTESTDTQQTNSDTSFTKTVSFPSIDSLLITADHYHAKNDAPVIVLCHQAGYSRGEYNEIATTLKGLGFNCLAIDQRSGNAVNGVANETAQRAKAAGKGQTYNDAKQDILASIAWAKKYYNKNVILWGSSYSSALALIIAAESSSVDRVLSFSPGEYLGSVSVKDGVKNLNKPAFLTSSKSEETQTKTIFDAIPSASKTQFVPKAAGFHGSKALWTKSSGNEEYWVAVKAFLP